MIRQLTVNDLTIVMPYLNRESSLNLFIIGDIENFGLDSEFQKVWGEFADNGALKAVMLKYHESFIFYSDRGDYDREGFVRLALATGQCKALSGKKELMEAFADQIGPCKVREMFFAELTRLEAEAQDSSVTVKQAEIADLPQVLDLRGSIEEFSHMALNLGALEKGLENKSARIYFAEQDSKMVASAATTAENSKSAMVVGVCTHPDYREQGLASACTKKLCEDVLEEGKYLCLFYDNPRAGKIYKRLGFHDIGKWKMLVRDDV